MKPLERSRRCFVIEVDGVRHTVEALETPFREGVELRTSIGDREVRVSDRGLGEAEARRLLIDEIKALR